MKYKRTSAFLYILLIVSTIAFSQTSSNDFIFLSGIENGIETPMRIAIDQSDNIYVTDVISKCIIKYDMNGNLIDTLIPGMSPISIAINQYGELFFGDDNTGYIYKIDANKQPEVFYTGTRYPSDMVFSHDNILYVSENQLKVVLAIDVSGDLIRTIGDNELVFPTGLAFDVKNNHILVAEHGGLGGDVSGGGMFGSGPLVEVHIFKRDGTLLNSFGSYGNWDGKFYRLQGITVGRCGNIYLCEPFQGSIDVFSDNGTYITNFGEFGLGTGQLSIPVDIAFDSQERIIISCYNKGSLELFTIQDPLPSAAILNPDINVCEGQQAEIDVKLTGTPPWSITFTHNDSNPTTINNISSNPYILTVNQPGIYRIVSVYDATLTGSCITGAAYVSFHPSPSSDINCGDQTICEGSTAVIPVYFTGDPPWTFTYTRDGNNATTLSTTHNPYLLEVNEPGTYEIISLSANNCDGTIFNGTSTITTRQLPSATIVEGNIRIDKCDDGSPVYLEVALTGSPPWTFTYTVDDANPKIIQTNDNPYFLNASLPGTYEIKEVSDNYCSSTNTSGYPELIIYPVPTAEFMVSELGLCPNSQGNVPIQFTGTPPFSFTITRNGNNPVSVTTSDNPYLLSVDKVGLYEIINLSDDNCNGNVSGESVVVSKAIPPKAKLPKKDIPLCEGFDADIPIYFESDGPWTFTYSLNGINPITLNVDNNPYYLIVNTPGFYEIVALSDANCDATKLPKPVEVVLFQIPIPNFNYVINNLEVSFINESINADSYQWYFGDGTGSKVRDPIHDYQMYGNYTVTLNAISEYCGYHSISKTINLINQQKSLIDNNSVIGSGIISENDNILSIEIYPNPCNDYFNIEIDGYCSENPSVEISNMTGQILYSCILPVNKENDLQGVNPYRINIGNIATGVYQLRFQCGKQIVRKLISVTAH